jgi:zinc-binding alcohol dehydrogenase family protein
MKVVGYKKSLPITDASALLDVTLPKPVASGRDLLVAVQAVSVNPVDTKVRRRAEPPEGEVKVLGFDAAGVVEAVGSEVTLFQPGDAVFYAGSIARSGSNAEFQLVDERIVGHKPKSLGFAAAAALPLTAITAWELLFDRLGIAPGKSVHAGTILITGGAGGVGSIMVQLARRLTGLQVITTASRPETKAWCLAHGAHHVIDHAKPLDKELAAIGLPQVDYVASLTETGLHFAAIVAALAPQGKFALIDDPATLDAKLLKPKSISLHWESMFTRSVFATSDMIAQHRLLNEVAALVDAGVLKSTLAEEFGRINAANLKRAHALIESGRSKGKIVLSGF